MGLTRTPRLAVDGDGHLYVAYLRISPEPEVRYATNAGGGWDDPGRDPIMDLGRPGVRRRCGGSPPLAVGRIGTEPGLWYGTDAGGAWSMDRVTTTALDGSVGLAVAPDGTASIAYGESSPGRSAWLATGTSGDWTLAKLVDGAATAPTPSRGPQTGHSTSLSASTRPARPASPTPRTPRGSWVVTSIGASSPTTQDANPSIALDAAGHAHIAFEALGTSLDATSIEYATNRTGAWVLSKRATGAPRDVEPLDRRRRRRPPADRLPRTGRASGSSRPTARPGRRRP